MDKKKRLLILIFVLILSGIVVIFIHKNGSMKGDSIMEENAISGDDNTHWFHSNGIITSIDNSQKKICVDISQKNNFFGLKLGQISDTSVSKMQMIFFRDRCCVFLHRLNAIKKPLL